MTEAPTTAPAEGRAAPRARPAAEAGYRADIDGLRAIAVLAVVFYHFGVPGLAGGFVGVDVFFVISGFLIGGILWREHEATGRVGLGAFLVRRVRRLAPAFFAMVAVTTLVSAVLLMPWEFREFGKSVISATVSLSNVLFWRQSGYFDAGAETKPLLHTWSLAVEEQFYIALPLVILACAGRKRPLIAVLAGAWAVSLAGSVALTPRDPQSTFYLFPFRAWELLTGVLLAIWGHETGRDWRGHPLVAWTGLALVAGSVALVPEGPGFPGWLAVPPVAGTALMIANGAGQGALARMLSSPGPVLVGRLSYSLYLWHWPVLILSLYLRGSYAGPLEVAGWMALSLALAWASWRFVETPVRRGRAPAPVLLGGAATASVAALAVGSAIYLRDGMPGRFGPEAQPHIAASADFLQDWSRCEVPRDGPFAGLETCPIGPEGAPEVLVWGDSHVRALREGLDRAAWVAGTPGVILWRAGCPPLFGIAKSESAATPAQDAACAAANARVQAAIPEVATLRHVLLVGRWSYYAGGEGVGLDAHNRIAVRLADGSAPDLAPAEVMARAARATVDALTPALERVFVLRQPPPVPGYDSRRAAREAAHAGLPLAPPATVRASADRAELEARTAAADAPWQALAEAGRVSRIDPWPRLCDARRCSALVDGQGWYFDNNHLTNTAALALADLFAPVFAAGEAGS